MAGGGLRAASSAELRAADVVVRYSSGDEGVAREVLADALAFDPLGLRSAGTGPGEPSPFLLEIAASHREFLFLTRGGLPDWGVAAAFPAEGRAVLQSPRLAATALPELRQIVHHEMAHLLLGRAVAGAPVPRWFDEGFAMYAAGEWGLSDRLALMGLLSARTRIPLRELTMVYPATEGRARLAYLEAYTTILFLQSLRGEEGLRAFIAEWGRSGDMAPALARVYGLGPGDFEIAWSQWLSHRFSLLAILTESELLFSSLGVAFLVLFLVYRRRYRRRLAQMEREERAEDPGGPGPGGVDRGTEPW